MLEIKKIDHGHKRVFASGASHFDDTYYDALLRICDKGCHVKDGKVIEMLLLTADKQEVLGIKLTSPLLWLGVSITDDKVWSRIASGQIKNMDISLGGGSVSISFPSPIEKNCNCDNKISSNKYNEAIIPSELEEFGGYIMETFQISKDAAGYNLIAKCAKAIETEQLGSLTAKDFEQAIDFSAKALAQSSGESVVKAYSVLLSTPFGKRLYGGMYAAKVNASAAS